MDGPVPAGTVWVVCEHQTVAIGDDNTLIGVDPPENMGSGNTIIGPTDAAGNTILNRGGVAVGRGARADGTSIAIGAGAMAGSGVFDLLSQLQCLLEDGHADEASNVAELSAELRKPDCSPSRVRQLWAVIKVAATTNEAATLVAQIVPHLHHLL